MNDNLLIKQSKSRSKTSRSLLNVSRRAGQAIVDFGLIQEGDRIAVAVSGGKDSLSLMHVLRHRQQVSPVNFSVCAVHVDFSLSDYDPQELFHYFKEHQFDYQVIKAQGLEGERFEDLDCYRFSRYRRKALFELVEKKQFTKVAFGHHMDDIVETILLNQFYRAEIGAMKPRQELFDGKVVIIRPLAYVRERHMIELAHELKIDHMGQSKCSYEDISHRMLIKRMLCKFEENNPQVVKNIFNSLKNIKSDYLLTPVA